MAELTYYDKQEHYKLVSVGNRSAASDATLESLKGTTSTGEFGSSLNYLFDPATGTHFRFEGIDHSRGSPTVRVGFRVPKDTSKRSIIFREGTTEVGVVTPYRGRCWIDPGSLQVVQIKERAYRIPDTFPITRSEGSTQYDRWRSRDSSTGFRSVQRSSWRIAPPDSTPGTSSNSSSTAGSAAR